MREVTDADREIGRRIKEARLLRRMSIKNLGFAVNVTFQQMQKYESGVNRISASRLATVARTLNVSVPNLLGQDDAMAAHPVLSPDALTLASAFDRLPETAAKRHLRDFVLGLAQDLSADGGRDRPRGNGAS